jgi:filamentous hemagglutinin family protein
MITPGLPPQIQPVEVSPAKQQASALPSRFSIAAPEMLVAQAIAPDNSTNTQVTVQGSRLDISGGSRSADGANLFHSFIRFGLDGNQVANFQVTPELQNVLSRVTGGDASYINGLIQMTGGNANLYLINPSGILFGPNIQLNLPAAFTATTATSVGFGNQLFQSAGNNDYSRLLGKPNSWIWSGNAGAIFNSGNMAVKPGQDLTLLAGTVVSTGNLSAPGGRLTVVAVPGSSRLRLSPAGGVLGLELLPRTGVPLVSPLSLAQLVTGGDLTHSTTVVAQADGTVQLTGSGLTVNAGDGVVKQASAGDALFRVDRNLLLSESQIRTTGSLQLLAGDSLRLRDTATNPLILQSGGPLLLGGDRHLDIAAISHPRSGLFSSGDLVLRSSNPVLGDSRFFTGGAFRIEQPNGSLGNLFSPNDPVIRASGDVAFDSYVGSSLHILAGGNVTIAGDVTINSAGGPALQDNVTLSDGSTLNIDGAVRPTLDIRAGTTAFAPTGVTGSTLGLVGTPDTNGAATGSNISIGNIAITSNNGQVLLTNLFSPNLNLASGAITTGNIRTSQGGQFPIAGDVVINARGNIQTGTINTAVFGATNALGGDVRLVAGNNLLFSTIETQVSGFGSPQAGAVNLFANGTIQGRAGSAILPTIDTQAISLRSTFVGTPIPGPITITHNGGPNNQPFIVGDATINGTAGSITTGTSTVLPTTVFAQPQITAAPNINITFNNIAPTISTPSPATATALNQPIQFTFADLQALAQDADGDNLTLQITPTGSGTLARNGLAIASGTAINPGDLITYTPPVNATGNLTALTLTASDGVSISNVVNIPVNIAVPKIANNLIPDHPRSHPLPVVVKLDRTDVILSTYLPSTTRLTDLSILRLIIPEHLPIFNLLNPGCGLGGCTVMSGSFNPGLSWSNFGASSFPWPGNSNVPAMLILPPNTPNPAPVAFNPTGPNPTDLSSNPGNPGSGSPGNPGSGNPGSGNPGSGNPGNPGSNPTPDFGTIPLPGNGQSITLPNCQGQVEQIAKRKVADRVSPVYQKLRECYAQQLNIAQQAKQTTLQTYALNNLATTAYVLGDYLQAIEYHQQQIKIAKADNNTVTLGMAYAGIGANYGALGDYTKAIDFYEQALARLPENIAPQWRALVLRNLGNASLIQHKIPVAIAYQNQSLAISNTIGDTYGAAQAYGNLGNAYADAADFPKSLESHQKSLKIAQTLGDQLQQAQAFLGLGTTSSYQRDFASAIGYHQQSLTLMRELQARLGEGITLTNLGDSLFRLSRFGESETTLMEGITVWETLRAGLGNNDAFKVSIFETQLNTYRNLQETLIAQKKLAPALEISERSRARAFIELLARHRNPGTVPRVLPPTIDQIRQIAKAQNQTIVQYSIMRDQFVENTHGGSVQFTAEAKDSILFIWVVQPTGNVAFRQVSLANVPESLAQMVTGSRSSIGTRGKLTIAKPEVTLQAGSSVRRQGEPLSWAPYKVVSVNLTDRTAKLSHPEIKISKPVPIGELYIAEPQTAQFYQLQQLHQILIAPIADLLPSDPNGKIVFVPQDSLFLVPFAALQNPQGEFLVDKHTIATVPAIQLLGINPTKPRLPQSNKMLIVGNPSPMPEGYTPLPGAEAEATAIAQFLKVQPLLAQSATESTIKPQLAQANIIHLATHGAFDERNPLLGAIALAPSAQEDGLLTAEEMLKLSLNADLVVLSACDTGRGKITGDGVLGLSRSWLAAGAANVVVSLWQVNDQATSALMVDFYRSLSTQPDKAMALRQAMLKTKQRFPSPEYWAAFTLIGI